MTPEDPADSSADYARGGAGEPPVKPKKGLSRGKQLLFLAAAIILAFLVGFVWQNMRADRLEGELERVSQELEFQRLESTVAAATIQAQQGNYEDARQRASDFFSRLQQELPDAPAEARPELEELMNERDSAITLLSRSEPESQFLMQRLYSSYRSAMGMAEGPAGDPDLPGPDAPPEVTPEAGAEEETPG